MHKTWRASLLVGKESACSVGGGRPGFDPWVGKIPWRRERLPTQVCCPREFHKESDTTEQLSLHFHKTWTTVPFNHKDHRRIWSQVTNGQGTKCHKAKLWKKMRSVLPGPAVYMAGVATRKVLHSNASKFGKLSSGHRTGKGQFYSNPKERQCKRMLRLPHNCTHLTC